MPRIVVENAQSGSNVTPLRRQKLIRVVYASVAADNLSAEALRDVAVVSARNNAAEKLTGVLLHTPDTFIQVLEGEERTLLATLERIDRDPRHHDLKILLDQVITERRFPDWAMGGYEIDASALPAELRPAAVLPPEVRAISGATPLAAQIEQAPPNAVLDFLERFYLIQTRAWPLV
ncbi:MAG: BLUF domain-containing protein [Pseudomonadota bacterium]